MAKTAPKKRRTSASKSRVAAFRAAPHAHLIPGLLLIVVGLGLLVYLIGALVVYLVGGTDGATGLLATLFPYPAASVLLPGYLGWFVLSVVIYLLLVTTAIKVIYYAITGAWRRRPGKAIVTVFLLAAGLAAQTTVPGPEAALVNYRDYVKLFEASQSIQRLTVERQQLQAPPTDDDELRINSLSRLIGLNTFVQQEAVKQGVRVSDKEVNDNYQRYVEQAQGEDKFRQQLDEIGLSVDFFKQEFIRVALLQNKLNEKISTDDEINQDRRQRAEALQRAVKEGKQDFAAAAKESDEPTGDNGGDQGFVKKGEAAPAIEAAVSRLNPNEISEVIKTDRGFVIVQVLEKQPDQNRYRQILINTHTLSDRQEELLRDAKVKVFVRGLIWDSANLQVKSKNPPAPTPDVTDSPAPAASLAPAPQ